ncbi:MAG: hypothetical protein C0478_13090 [Planctomyces sp.]|nr:hypothetical protein [Planctomyces sp.]
MVTFWGSDSVLIQQQRANRIAIEIANLRGRVERVKIEASIDNSEVPTSTIDTEEFPGRYFEHHVNVLLGSNSDLDFLTFLATENDARLSQNIRRRRADGQSERFLTQRVFRNGRYIARTKLTGLLDQLADANIQILDIEEEYVLYDSHIMLDSGWLEPKGEMKQ